VRSSARALEQAPGRSITTIKSGNTDVDIEEGEEIEPNIQREQRALENNQGSQTMDPSGPVVSQF